LCFFSVPPGIHHLFLYSLSSWWSYLIIYKPAWEICHFSVFNGTRVAQPV
jgi:hypothetical protein